MLNVKHNNLKVTVLNTELVELESICIIASYQSSANNNIFVITTHALATMVDSLI